MNSTVPVALLPLPLHILHIHLYNLIGLNICDYEIFSLPAKKWHWRARTGALYFSQIIPVDHEYKVLFTSSVLNLAELLGVRPDLVNCKKIVYFHENQLVYPVREVKERDCQYGLNQILTWCVLINNFYFIALIMSLPTYTAFLPTI